MAMQRVQHLNGVYYRDNPKTLQLHYPPSKLNYNVPHVQEVQAYAKPTLLNISSENSSKGERTLEALGQLDPLTRNQFGLKKTAIDQFTFRLLYDCANCLEEPPQSFIILSYSWHSSAWSQHPCLQTSNLDACPLTLLMWNAFLAQRDNINEPFWIDQLCITQTSSMEKHLAIGAMDLLYRSARKVVIALEDIALNKQEVDSVFAYVNRPPMTTDLSEEMTRDDLNNIASTFRKIIEARWFARAWCLHEFLVSKRHAFLIPVHSENESRAIGIIRVDGPFLFNASRIWIRQEIEHQNLGEISRRFSGMDQSTLLRARRLREQLGALDAADAFGTETVHSDGSYMHMFAEIATLGAFEVADKISIVLNTLESGLYYRGVTGITIENCCRLITIVALAAGDPTALTLNGLKLRSLNENQWLRMPLPGGGDQARPQGSPIIPPTIMNTCITKRGLEIDVVHLCTHKSISLPDQYYLSMARLLVDNRGTCTTRIPSTVLRLDDEMNEPTFADLRLYYIQALACVLQCGKEWSVDCYKRLQFSSQSGIIFDWEDRAKEGFEEAIDWALATEIEEDISPDMNEMWEEVDWSLLPWEHNCYAHILNFVDVLIGIGLAIPNKDDQNRPLEPCAVQICTIEQAEDTSQFVVFTPKFPLVSLNTWRSLTSLWYLCIPKALVSESYNWMSRAWILEDLDLVESNDGMKAYAIVAKTRLIGPATTPKGLIERAIIAR
ncbi:MAG: hypothetical protein M1834_008411 [Cirrosporium novae-zelandiae]|nr:MAG: hypothetical protein M1834_008411 [Cirrosporium novae-zelandiae]